MARNTFKRKAERALPTTRVSVVIIDENKHILLVRHRKGSRAYWVLPGGRMEYGETFKECAARELKEETGLDVEAQNFLFLSEAIAPDRSRHIINIFVKGKVVGGTLRLGKEPVLAGVEYIPLSELQNLELFPPITEQILKYHNDGHQPNAIKYLGNLWV